MYAVQTHLYKIVVKDDRKRIHYYVGHVTLIKYKAGKYSVT